MVFSISGISLFIGLMIYFEIEVLHKNSDHLLMPLIYRFIFNVFASFCGLVRLKEGIAVVICAGASTSETRVQMYDIAANTWTVKTELQMPHPLVTGLAMIIDNRFFALGGWDTTGGNWIRTDHVYELKFEGSTKGWIKLKNQLPVNTVKHYMVVLPFPKRL